MPHFMSPFLRLTHTLPLCAALLSLACSSSSDDAPATAGTGGVSAGGTGGAGAAGLGGSGGVAAAGSAGSAPAAGALCPEGSLFCDDFEDDVVGGLGMPWRSSTNAATVAVDEVQAFSGSKAVHVNAPQAGTYHRGYFALDQGSSAGIFPAVAQEMYGRTMVYLGVLPNADAHWTFIQGEGLAADASHNALYRFGGQHQNGAQLMANYETTQGVSTDCWDHSATLMPVAEWACVEWHFTVATNDMQFWLNGTEVSDMHVTQQGEGCIGDALGQQWIAPPAFQSLYLGWEHYQQAANPIDVWMDDVVVDTKRVGCPAAP
jgi:hypothetical protein